RRPWVSVVEGGDSHGHAHLLPQVADVAGHERDEERCPGDRTVDSGDLRGPDPQLFSDLGRRRPGPALPGGFSPLRRLIRDSIDGVERQSLGDVLRIAMDDPYDGARAGEHA